MTYGRIFSNALDAANTLGNVDLIKLNKIYPINEEVISLLEKYNEIYFFEEGVFSGGVAENIGCRLLKNGYRGKYSINAINDEFVGASTIQSALKKYKLDCESMIEIVGK